MFPALIIITKLSVSKDGTAEYYYNTLKFDSLRQTFNGIKIILDQNKEYFENKDNFLLELQKIKKKQNIKNKKINEKIKDKNEIENENEEEIESEIDGNSDQNVSDSESEMSDNESIKSANSKISKISKKSKKL